MRCSFGVEANPERAQEAAVTWFYDLDLKQSIY